MDRRGVSFKLRLFLGALALAVASVCAPIFAAGPHEACRSGLRSLGAILDSVEAREEANIRSGRLMRPSFFDFGVDVEAAKSWGGIEAPRLISDLLPPNVRLIDHSLLVASERGVVKDHGSGEFVSLRVDVDGVGTNVGVSRSALLANLNQSQKTFVRPSSKAVIIFMHGGGTRTTGHHVGINLMNTFAQKEVDVISLDLPWHGEGPREIYRSRKVFFEWLRSFVEKYVSPSGKPVFLAGHSMGGEFADTYMRLYPNDKLVAGVMALSPPIDARPGVGLAEKIQFNQARDEEIRGPESQTPEDRELLKTLVSQNKLSFTALLFESLFSLQTSWVLPKEATGFIPALYVWGEKDWLYAGNEEVVENYLRPLKNVRLKIYGRRYDVVEKKEISVGHLIFDHHRPGTTQMEAFLDIQDFIEEVVGVPLVLQKPKSQNEDLLKKIVQAYINNLAFREFAESYVVYRRVPNKEKMAELNARAKALQEGPASEESAAELKRINLLRQGAYIPEGAEGDLGRQWQAEYLKAKEAETATQKRRDALKKELESLRPKIRQYEKKYEDALKGVTNESLHRADQKIEGILTQMHSMNSELERTINAFYQERLMSPDRDRLSFEPTAEISTLMRNYETLSLSLQNARREKEEIFGRLVSEGALGAEGRLLYVELYEAGGLYWKEKHLMTELEELDLRIADFQFTEENLLRLLAEKYSEGLYHYESRLLKDLLNSPANEWQKAQPFLQEAWGRWQLLWKDRPPVEKTSLY